MDYLSAIYEAGFKGKLVGNEFHTQCPDCHKNKFYINIKSGSFICFSGSCSQAGHIKKYVQTHNINPDELFQRNLFNVDIEDGKLITNPEDELKDWEFIHPYILKRGFAKEFLIANKIGYDKNTHSITIPAYDSYCETKDCYLGAIKRSVIEGFNPKYSYPPGFQKAHNFYKPFSIRSKDETEFKTKDLIICEGSLDALKAAQYGYDTISSLGCYISKDQAEVIKGCFLNGGRIILAFDLDDAGVNGVKTALKNYPTIDFYLFPDMIDRLAELCYNKETTNGHTNNKVDKKDICEMTEQELDYNVQHAQHKMYSVLNEVRI